MKRLILGIIALTAITFSASAQEQREFKQKKSMERGEHQRGMMKDLNLTEAQKIQMKANREEMKTKMEALKANKSQNLGQYEQQKEALMKEQKAKMESVLTVEQKAKMATQKANREKLGKEKQNAKFEETKTKLGLSNEQGQQMKALNQQSHDRIKAIRDNNTLSDEAKKEQIKALKNETNEQRKSILTPEQQNKLKEMKKEGMRGHDMREKREMKGKPEMKAKKTTK